MRIFLLFPFLLLFSLTGQAEYRLFVLEISKPNEDKTQPPITRTVQSSLDPEQYRGYYPVAADETIRYVQTWKCKGPTYGDQDFCPNPSQKAQIPTPSVSNQNAP